MLNANIEKIISPGTNTIINISIKTLEVNPIAIAKNSIDSPTISNLPDFVPQIPPFFFAFGADRDKNSMISSFVFGTEYKLMISLIR